MREQARGFASFLSPDVAGMQCTGFECVDTASALVPCDGCSTMDESASTRRPLRRKPPDVLFAAEHDCTSIRHADGVECEQGRCTVFSCEPGFRPDEEKSACVDDGSEARRRRRRVAIASKK